MADLTKRVNEDHPVLAAILAKRHIAASSFTPEFSGQRFEDYDRGLIDAYRAAEEALKSFLECDDRGFPRQGGKVTV
jgi:hypothetical protein